MQIPIWSIALYDNFSRLFLTYSYFYIYWKDEVILSYDAIDYIWHIIYFISFYIISHIFLKFQNLGSVPIYLGDSEFLKKLVPEPKSIIYLADYNQNYTKLSEYLNYLSENKNVYEEYRSWTKRFSYEKNIENNSLLRNSWYCKICSWVRDNNQQNKISKMSPCLPK